MKATKTTTPLRDRCLSHCATLGIPLEGASLDELLSRAEKENLSHLHFLDLLLGTQADARRERAVARRIREARFADTKTLEGFDWRFNPKAFDRVWCNKSRVQLSASIRGHKRRGTSETESKLGVTSRDDHDAVALPAPI